MKKILILILLNISVLFAFEVDIKTDPDMPVKDEAFRLIFEITSEKGGEPIISFDPLGAEVTEKINLGTSTRTTLINGKLSTSRKVSVAYIMQPQQIGSVFIRNIKVDLNGETKKIDTIRKTVLSEPRRARDIFALAEVDKTEAFVNESILVRYYLYNKVSVTATDIVKFPDLDKFMKRFHQEKLRPERVRYNGEIYLRRIIYTAQVFANQPGEYKIDPIKMSVSYTKSRDPFDSLGFGGGFARQSKLSVTSKPIEIKIKQLPIDNVPKNFTGLVGKHDFKLKFNKSRFVVNEPIEVKLEVSGAGALELFEAPRVLTDPSIESFEVTSDLQLNADFKASKSFEYTYLGRDNYTSEASKLGFSYFDPESLSFKEVLLDIPAIKIAGTAASGKKKQGENKLGAASENNPNAQNNGNLVPVEQFDYYTPLYNLHNTYQYNSKYIALVFIIIALLVLFIKFKDDIAGLFKEEETHDLFSRIMKEGISYGDLYLLSELLGKDQDIKSRIQKSELPSKHKTYLLELLNKFDKSYKSNKNKVLKTNKGIIKDIKKYLSGDNEF